MRKIINLLCLILSIQNSLGQDYQTINSKTVAFFDNSNKNVRSIRIDSVKYLNDSILYPYTIIQKLGEHCFSPTIASWIGEKVIISEEGTNLFFNKDNDTIKIISKAKLNQSWIAYHLIDSLIIKATIISHDTLGFLSLNDSVKTIGFQVYDKNMNPLVYDLNNMKIQISKKYGFVKIFNFYFFPNFHINSPPLEKKFEEYNLVGLSNPSVGVQNLTFFEVFDFQIGDELHILEEYDNRWGDFGYAKTKKTIYKYNERIDYSDSIVYNYFRRQSIHSISGDQNTFDFYNDTVKQIIREEPWFDKLPEEPIINGLNTYYYSMTNEVPLSKTNMSSIENFDFEGDSCWSDYFIWLYEGCHKEYKYIKGLGGPYYICPMIPEIVNIDRRELVYYKKGEISFGTPLIVNEFLDIETLNIKNIEVFPNPAGDYISVVFNDIENYNCTLDIFNLNGVLIKSIIIELNNSRINISDLRSGIYFYKLFNEKGLLKTDKLIIDNTNR